MRNRPKKKGYNPLEDLPPDVMWVDVASTHLRRICFDKDRGFLFVAFMDGSCYRYSNVPEAIFTTLLNAASPGEYFQRTIRPHPSEYPYRKMN